MRGGSRLGVVGALALSGVLAVTGCGGSGSGGSGSGGPDAGAPPAASAPAAGAPDGVTVVAAAYTKTAAAQTARMSISFHIRAESPSGAGGADVRASGNGVIDFGNERASITVHTPMGDDLEQRLIGSTAYVRLPDRLVQADPRLQGKHWLKADLSRASSANLGFGIEGTDGSDPTQVLRLLSEVSDRVDTVGTDSVRGADTTHYRAHLDLDEIAAKRGSNPQQIEMMKTLLGTNTFPVDVWVDDQGRARRLEFRFPPKPVSTGQPGQPRLMVEASLEWYDFGTPVSVEPPPADDVVDAATLGPQVPARSPAQPPAQASARPPAQVPAAPGQGGYAA